MSEIKGPFTVGDPMQGYSPVLDGAGDVLTECREAADAAHFAELLNLGLGAKRMRWALEQVVRSHRGEHDPADHIGVTPALCCRMAWDAKGGLDGVDVRPDAEREELALLRSTLAGAVKALDGLNSFYGQGLQVHGWHLNGEPEPFDNFLTDNGAGEAMDAVRAFYAAHPEAKEGGADA